MPLNYVRRLTSLERSERANRHLANILAFVAGAVNAGGFVAVGQYTSHMSGIVSSMAYGVSVERLDLFLAGFGALASFIAGAAVTAILINWGRRQALTGVYAYPLMLEAALLLAFGFLGGSLQTRHWFFTSATVSLLCFIMGLQNAMITKLSQAEIRTTHVTGMVTDIGIELGKLLYWNRDVAHPLRVAADQQKLTTLTVMVAAFFTGGIAGAVGFAVVGFVLTIPLALALLALTLVPAAEDARAIVAKSN